MTYKEASEKVANWWWERIEENKKDFEGTLISLRVTEFSKFSKRDFTGRIVGLLNRENKNLDKDTIILSVDYDPNWILKSACEFGKIDLMLLPMKTVTWVKKQEDESYKVIVAHGYRSKQVEI